MDTSLFLSLLSYARCWGVDLLPAVYRIVPALVLTRRLHVPVLPRLFISTIPYVCYTQRMWLKDYVQIESGRSE